jgi:hypothetical protein
MINSNISALTLQLDPMISVYWIIALAVLFLILFILSLIFFKHAALLRLLTGIVFITALLNPSFVTELREKVKDVALVVQDVSPSQSYGDRGLNSDLIRDKVETNLASYPDLEVRYVTAPVDNNKTARETRLFEAIESNYADVPTDRRAGVIMITDGQVHDVPEHKISRNDFGPLHTILSGQKDDIDRQIIITEAAAYGIIGQHVTIKYKIVDHGNTGKSHASIVIKEPGEEPQMALVPVNEEQEFTIEVNHAGQNIVTIEAASLDNELTILNNTAPIIIQGVRDRLRVLLISGKPHAGGRTWRNLLTAEPSVDLVHFTILRQPEKVDATPHSEMSLIEFPFRELFEIKLYEFDLIVFDQYSLNNILPDFYFENIATYVKNGGALLEASGPSFVSADSLYNTTLKSIIPARPNKEALLTSFRPTVTELGKRHPVVQNLYNPAQPWGNLLRQIDVTRKSGDVLMTGANKIPLLLLDHVGEGRIAQLTSDQFWLWSRDYDGGGPQVELFRRIAHWLMKEPELDENAMNVNVNDDIIHISRRSVEKKDVTVNIQKPDNSEEKIVLKADNDGIARAQIKADQIGVYQFKDDIQHRIAIIGDLNPPELKNVVTTEQSLKAVSQDSTGRIFWHEDGIPRIRYMSEARSMAGPEWLALRKTNSFSVTGLKITPVLPLWAYIVLILSLLIGGWWNEGRKRKAV